MLVHEIIYNITNLPSFFLPFPKKLPTLLIWGWGEHLIIYLPFAMQIISASDIKKKTLNITQNVIIPQEDDLIHLYLLWLVIYFDTFLQFHFCFLFTMPFLCCFSFPFLFSIGFIVLIISFILSSDLWCSLFFLS